MPPPPPVTSQMPTAAETPRIKTGLLNTKIGGHSLQSRHCIIKLFREVHTDHPHLPSDLSAMAPLAHAVFRSGRSRFAFDQHRSGLCFCSCSQLLRSADSPCHLNDATNDRKLKVWAQYASPLRPRNSQPVYGHSQTLREVPLDLFAKCFCVCSGH